MNNTLSKIYILDAVRGVAAMIVALYHFIHFSNHHGSLFDEKATILKTVDPFLHGSICVFFIISGYVIFLHLERNGYRIQNYGIFLWKRILRMHLPLSICLLLIVVVNTVFQSYLGLATEVDPGRLLANITLTASFFDYEWYNPIFWTLSIEFQFYLVIGILFSLLQKRPSVALISTGLVLIPLNYIGNHTSYFDTTPYLVHFGSYFLIGIGMYLFHQKRFSAFQLSVLIAIGAIDCFLGQPDYYYVLPFLTIPIMLFVKSRFRLLELSGEVSYSFYLMHGMFGGWFLYFTARYADQTWEKIGLIILALLISYAGSYPFYKLIEKSSFRLSRNIKYKK